MQVNMPPGFVLHLLEDMLRIKLVSTISFLKSKEYS